MSDKDFFRDIGYDVFGPALLGFASRIGQKMTQLSGENAKLFFLARDGEIVMRACKILSDKYPALRGGSYLYASRKAFGIGNVSIFMKYASGVKTPLLRVELWKTLLCI